MKEEMARCPGDAACWLSFFRASGDVVCVDCGKEYRKHKHCPVVSFSGDPVLRVLCNGDHVKL